MNRCFLLFSLLILPYLVMGQGDLPTTKPLEIKAENNTLDVKTSNKGTRLKMPSVLDDKLIDKERKIKMLDDRKLVQAGTGMKIDPKVGQREKRGANQYYGDQYLGDFKTSSTFIGVVARDHEYVDGDRVKIYVNGNVVEHNLLLSANFKGVNVDLNEGFNKIEFEALNQGSSGPNTAQVMVTDDSGKVIHNYRWNLSTGSMASIVVVKQPDMTKGEEEEQN